MWTKLFIAIIAGFLCWLLYRNIKSNPEAFSKHNLGKSFSTLGILALLLIAFVALLVVLTK